MLLLLRRRLWRPRGWRRRLPRGRFVPARLGAIVWLSCWRPIRSRLGATVWLSCWRPIRSRLGAIVRLSCWRPIWSRLRPVVWLCRRGAIRSRLRTIVWLCLRWTIWSWFGPIIRLRCRWPVIRLCRFWTIWLRRRWPIFRLIGLRSIVWLCHRSRTLVRGRRIARPISRLVGRRLIRRRSGLSRPRGVAGLVRGRVGMSRCRRRRFSWRRYLHRRTRRRCRRGRTQARDFTPGQGLSGMRFHRLLPGSERRWRRRRSRLRNHLPVRHRCRRRGYMVRSRGS